MKKRRLFCYFSVNPCMPASRWRRLLKLKRKQKTLLRLSLASFSPHHYSQQQRSPFRMFIAKLSNALKSLKSKKSLQESTNRASECHSPHRIYNSLLRMRAIHELKRGKGKCLKNCNDYSGPLPRFIQAKNHLTIALIQSTINVCTYKQLMR